MVFTPPEIVAASKALAETVVWSVDGRYYRFDVALNVNGMGLAGLTLKGKAPIDIPNRGVAITMCWRPARARPEAFTRACWRPLGIHKPKKWRPSWGVPQTIGGSHLHCPDGNWIEDESRVRSGNLPYATPIEPEPETFEKFVALVQNLYNVEGLSGAIASPWPQDIFTQ